MVDNFEIKSLITDWKGYNSSRDKTFLKDGWLVRGSQNVYKKISGTIAVRVGLKRYDAADTTVAGVDSDFTYNTSQGFVRPLRIANSKLQIYFNNTWNNLATALTKTLFSFRKWWDNTEKKDRVIIVDGDGNIYHWSGGCAILSSATVNTITKTGATTFANSGFASNTAGEKKVIVNGTTYTYTGGETTTTLTGVTPDPSGEAANSNIIQQLQTTSSSPAAGFNTDFVEIVGNQLYCFSYTSRNVYISKNTDFTNFTVPGTPAAGDPDLVTLDNTPKAVAIRQGKAHVFAGTSDLFLIFYTLITVGSNLVRQTNVEHKSLANKKSCLGFDFIDTVGDTIVYLTQDQQLVAYGDYRNIFQPTPPLLSLAVYDELKEEDFTGGELRAIEDYVYIVAPLNGKTYLYQQRQNVDALGNVFTERLWQPPMIWNISRITTISGTIYGYSNANPQLYQLYDTLQWHDDSPATDASGNYEKLAYRAVMALAYQNHGRRQDILYFDKVYYEGYVTQGTHLSGDILFEYQGAEGNYTVSINDGAAQAKSFSGLNAPSIGDASIGDNPLGDGIRTATNDQDTLPKFKDIESITQTNCTEYQLIVYSETIDSRWEILAIGTNAALADEEQPVKLIKR